MAHYDVDENDNEPESHANTIKAVHKLLESIKNGELTGFDQREANALRQMANLWLGFESVGLFFTYIRQILMIIGFFVASYLAFKGYFVDWIKGPAK